MLIAIKKAPIFGSNLQENNKMTSKREAETFLVEFNLLKSASTDRIINKLIKQKWMWVWGCVELLLEETVISFSQGYYCI